MVKINERCMGIYHRLIANKEVGTLNQGELIDVMIQKMSDGRFGIMASSFGIYFYIVLETEEELHETSTEQFTNLPNYSEDDSST